MPKNLKKIAILACNSEKMVYSMCVAERLSFQPQTNHNKEIAKGLSETGVSKETRNGYESSCKTEWNFHG